jgi:hypothetical protein
MVAAHFHPHGKVPWRCGTGGGEWDARIDGRTRRVPHLHGTF